MQHPYTQKQIRHLKGWAQRLPARLVLGKEGLSPAFVQMVQEALEREELVKVRLGAQEDRGAKNILAQQLAGKTKAFLVTRLGHVAVLYRPGRATKITLPS